MAKKAGFACVFGGGHEKMHAFSHGARFPENTEKEHACVLFFVGQIEGCGQEKTHGFSRRPRFLDNIGHFETIQRGQAVPLKR